MKKRRASFTQIVQISDRLKESGEMRDGFWVYAADHSDRSIAEDIGVSISSVMGVRRDLFGDICRGPNSSKSIAEPRLAKIESVVGALTERVACLERAMTKLETALKLSQIGRVNAT